MLMNKTIGHIGCYFVGEVQQIQMHLIVTSTMLCVMTELVSIMWPKNFVVRKLQVLDTLSYIPIAWTGPLGGRLTNQNN